MPLLEDFKKSVSGMTQDEMMELHSQLRGNRNRGVLKKGKKAAKPKADVKKMKQDELKAALEMLKEL